MPLRFANERTDRLPVDMTGVTPSALAGLSLDSIRRTRMLHGKCQAELGELFDITGSAADLAWQLEGDFSATHAVGADMRAGHITVRGPLGRHAAAGMHGGRLDVYGSVGDFLGADMRGGTVRIHGDAGDHVGAASLGSRRGTTGGTILIDGAAGHGLGARMRRGLIAVAGAVGDDLGAHLLAGTLLTFGPVGARIGAGMRRGTIGLFGPAAPTLLPTYRLACRCLLPMLGLIENELRRAAFGETHLPKLRQPVELYHGDLLELGRGEILLTA